MNQVKRFDSLPNKVKFIVGGGKSEKARERFPEIKVYECRNKDEIYEVMKKESLEPMTMIDRDPLQGRSFFVALGLPGRRTVKDLIYFNEYEETETVLYFAEMNSGEVREAMRDERQARRHYRQKLKNRELKKEALNNAQKK